MIPLKVTGDQANNGNKMLIAATLMLEIGKIDAKQVLAAKQPCSMGKVKINGEDWTLTGGDRVFVRRISSPNDRAPIASVYPFVDLIAAMQASTNHTAPPPTHYVLITSTGSVDTIWTAYETVPSDQQLTRDVDAAIAGRAGPASSVDVTTKKINIFIGKP